MKLRDYQEEAVSFLLSHSRANIYLSPGMGKSAIVLHAIARAGFRGVLVVAPKLVAVNTWGKEHLLWPELKHMSVAVLRGTPDQRRHVLQQRSDVTVINPELIPWLFETLEGKWPFKWVVFDESTRLKGMRAKGHGTQRAGLLAAVAHTKVERWTNLSGTPTANSLLDLWGPQYVVDAGAALGRSFSAYQQRWFRPENPYYVHSRWIPHGHSQAEIETAIKPSTFSVKIEDYFPVGKAVDNYIEVPLTLPAQRAYDQMKKELRALLDKEEVTAFSAPAMAGKLRQIVSGAVYMNETEYKVVHSARLEALESLVEELSGAPLAVVYLYRHEREQLQKRFPEAVIVQDKMAVERWNRGEIPILLLHAASAGHGLNLAKGGHHIAFMSVYSDAELYAQVIERLGPVRQAQAGLHRTVQHYHFVTKGTIDDQSRLLRESRIGVMQAFLESLKR